MAKEALGSAMTSYDTVNAIMSMETAKLTGDPMKHLAGGEFGQDAKLFKTRQKQLSMKVDAVDGQTIDIKPGCGGLQGTPEEPERVGEVFNKMVERWQARLMRHEWARALIAKCPVCGKAIDLAITAFVDDLFRRILCDDVEQLEERMAVMDKYLDEEMAKDNMKQNDKKKKRGREVLWGGRGEEDGARV